jgi:hypothetical protein
MSSVSLALGVSSTSVRIVDSIRLSQRFLDSGAYTVGIQVDVPHDVSLQLLFNQVSTLATSGSAAQEKLLTELRMEVYEIDFAIRPHLFLMSVKNVTTPLVGPGVENNDDNIINKLGGAVTLSCITGGVLMLLIIVVTVFMRKCQATGFEV